MIVTLTLERIELSAPIGCYDLEREVGSRMEIEVSVDAEVGDAPRRDDLDGTINYVQVYELIRRIMAEPMRLVEHAALRIADTILERFAQARRVRVRMTKLAPPVGGKMGGISVRIERDRDEAR